MEQAPERGFEKTMKKVASDKEFFSKINKLEKETDFLLNNKKTVFAVITAITLLACWLAYA